MADTLPGAEALSKITDSVRNHETSFVNGIVVVVTVSGEELFRKVAFLCPCSKPSSEIYGASFIWGPATVLFTLGLIINNVTWRLLHGCYHRSKSTSHGLKRTSGVCVTLLARALVAPAAWIFVSFLDGSYYMCMSSTTPCVPIANSTENRELIAESQVIAWIFLVVVILITMTVLVGTRCIDKFTYVQSKYIEAYQELEQLKFDEEMRSRASRFAEKNVKEFFDKDIRMKSDWDEISMAPSCDVVLLEKPPRRHNRFGRFLGNFPEPFFTPLHKWANKERRKRSMTEEEQMQIQNLLMSPPAPMTYGNNTSQELEDVELRGWTNSKRQENWKLEGGEDEEDAFVIRESQYATDSKENEIR